MMVTPIAISQRSKISMPPPTSNSGLALFWGSLCHKGARKHLEDYVFTRMESYNSFFAVFDGHCGKEAARYAHDNLWEGRTYMYLKHSIISYPLRESFKSPVPPILRESFKSRIPIHYGTVLSHLLMITRRHVKILFCALKRHVRILKYDHETSRAC